MSIAARLLVVVAVVGALSGCTDVASTDDASGDAFARFPACQPPDPDDGVSDDVPGLLLPDGAIVTSAVQTGPITDVAAYVPRAPLDVRAFYEARDDVEILQIEDEVFETEILVGDGDLRSYVIARAACRDGSHITAFVAPANAVAALPAPGAGGAGP